MLIFKWILAVFIAIHAIAHLIGFLVPWRLAKLKEMPYKTTVLSGKVDMGDMGIRIIGVLWLLVALGFLFSAFTIFCACINWIPFTLSVTWASLLLCLVGWPDSKIGIFVNAGLLVILYSCF